MTAADKLRERADDLRPKNILPDFCDGIRMRHADALDLLADAETDLREAPHAPGCSGEFGYPCKCGRIDLLRRISVFAGEEKT